LPTITDPLTIDGYTQAGSSQNTLTTGINAVLRIVLNGVNAGTASGLTLQANNCVIRGLVITRFSFYGIDIRSRNNAIEGNFIGTGRHWRPLPWQQLLRRRGVQRRRQRHRRHDAGGAQSHFWQQ
jgi:hypothetical protein